MENFLFTPAGNFRTGKVVGTVLGFFLALALVFGTFYTVPAGNVGVVTLFSAVNRVAYPGFNVKIPFVEHAVRMNVQTQKDEVDAAAASKDLQSVTAKIAVNYSLDPKYAAAVYQSIGPNYRDTILSPITQNAFKAVTAQYTAEELITKREAVRAQAEQMITEQAAVYHLVVVNFLIENFDFSKEFNDAIEKKQVAQQEVETAKQILAKVQIDAQAVAAKAQGEADAQVIQAKAEAQSIELRGTALRSNPEVIQYQFVQQLNNVQWGILPGDSITPLMQFPNLK